jgi:L-malate glycosyltransferase
MRLCFLGDVRSVHVQKFVNYFSKNHETHLISFDYIGDSRVEPGIKFFKDIGTHVHIIKKAHMPISPFVVKSLIKSINPDLVQAHFVTHYGFLGAFSGVHPLVISAMGDDVLIHPFTNDAYYMLVTYALHDADFIICDGVNSMLTIIEFGIPKDKVSLIYPGIDMTLFRPYEKVNCQNKIIFCPRGFDKIYDTDTLFSAMKIIYKQYPTVKFVLLGVGTEFERFKNLVIQSGMENVVQYLGHIPNNQLPQYLAFSDVSITTSLSDGGIPVSTIEAMACGVPVVSTDAGDAALWIRDSGYVVNKQNPEMLANRVIELLNDDSKRLLFGAKARKIVERTQDYNLEMKKIENLYERLLKNDS